MMAQSENVNAVSLGKKSSGIFSSMIEVATAEDTIKEQKAQDKAIRQKEMQEAEAEHQKLVEEEEAEEKAERKKTQEAEQKAQDEANYQAALKKRQQIINQAAQQDDDTQLLTSQMNIEALQDQAARTLQEEEAKIKSVKPSGMLERAQQKALIEEKERATAEALKNMGGQSLVQLEASELPAELGLPGAPATESAPASSTPAETAPAASTPAETAPAATTPAASTPAETTPSANAPAETTPAATTPAATTPAATTPAETTPAATTTPAESAPKASISSGSSSSTSSSTSSGSSSSGSVSAPVSEAKLSKAEENEIKTYSKLGASLPVNTDVTVPSFRTSHLKDDAAKKDPVTATPCAHATETADLDNSNAGDMLPYPNKIVTEKDQDKERTTREADAKTALRPSKYASNFEKPSFGAPTAGKTYYSAPTI